MPTPSPPVSVSEVQATQFRGAQPFKAEANRRPYSVPSPEFSSVRPPLRTRTPSPFLFRPSSDTHLDKWAESEPTFEELKEIAAYLAVNYVGTSDRIEGLRNEEDRDEQLENALLINMYYLLYEELTYAMNTGDIGRVEACFVPWTLIFKGVGKHKYAAEMIRHITNVHFFYPEGLK